VPVLVKGWQDHESRVAALVAVVQQQQQQIAALEARLAALEG